jgi:hypothetical protein
MEHPTVQAVAKIDVDVQQLLEDAENIISSSQRPTSRRTKLFLAHNQDVALDQFDSSPEGLRLMKMVLDEASETEDDPPSDTNLWYRRVISDRPMPNPWIDRKSRDYSPYHSMMMQLSLPSPPQMSEHSDNWDRTITSKLKVWFSQQMAALKRMGFSDEDVILQALTESKGDVQIAAKLLLNRFFCD